MDDVLKTTEDGRYRVRIVLDDDPSQPEDEYGWPILRVYDRGYGSTVMQVKGVGPEVPGDIPNALQHWHQRGDREFFERYMRINHGTTSMVTIDTGDCHYVVFDTAALREAYGLTDEHIAANPEHFAGRELVWGTAEEWRAYVEGDVYGYVVEEIVTWTTEADYDDREEWEHVDSCWGFYGWQYAEESALTALEDAAHRTNG